MYLSPIKDLPYVWEWAFFFKTLFNIVGAQFKQIFNKCLCCMMMFRTSDGSLYSQDTMRLLSRYIWLNITVRLIFYSSIAVYGRSEYGKSSNLSTFHFFEALDNAFEVHFIQGFILHLIKDTDSMQLRF